ncbi:MAG: translation initiation factor IF-2 [Candidatus Gastranaerophilales bacterium]|nr:translation initiation factor IF-2 [Candidatus Gastranaerophilales bacterium]
MSEKIRVYELATQLGLTSKEILFELEKKIGLSLKSTSSTISKEDVDKFIEAKKSPAHTNVSEQRTQRRPVFSNEAPKAPVETARRAVKLIKKAKPQPEPEEPEIKAPQPELPKAEVPKVQPIEPKKEEPKTEIAQKVPTIEIEKIEIKKANPQKIVEKVEPKRETPQGLVKPKTEKTEVSDDNKPKSDKDKDFKKPIKRHIIANESYGKKGRKVSKQDKLDEKEKQLQQQKNKKKEKIDETPQKVEEVVINQPLTVGDLASKINYSTAEIVKELMMIGVLATVNQTIDVPTATRVCEKLEIKVNDIDLEKLEKEMLAEEEEKKVVIDKHAVHRAPVVTIMGHVDHGKTTLLDSIRASKHKIVATEVGGITQSIGAYSVIADKKKIVFIDTPGHEAFTEMRARGAQTTDIVILVVAADDGIMPQTIEAINHAKAAKVPIIIAVNKMDKESANPDRVLQQLTEYGLVPEEWGGDTITVKVSALRGTGIDELLEYILLVSEVQDLKANPSIPAEGVVIEANLDKGKGPVATLLVQKGTLKIGDFVAVNTVGGKVRALLSDSGERIKKAGPSTPVEILGLSEVPQAGDKFIVCESEKKMKNLVESKKQEEKMCKFEAIAPTKVKTDLIDGSEIEVKELNLIIKANTHGSAEAVSAAVQQLSAKSIIVNIVHIAVGDISEADVMLASASNAIIIGFSVKEDSNAQRAAENQCVRIKKYDIIYEILEDLEKTMLGLLDAEIKEVEIGQAEIRQVFTVGKTVKIAGCYVTEGKIQRNGIARLERNGKEIFKGQIDQLKRFKDDVKEVATGYECGISFAKFNDIQEGDIIKVYTTEEVKKESLV